MTTKEIKIMQAIQYEYLSGEQWQVVSEITDLGWYGIGGEREFEELPPHIAVKLYSMSDISKTSVLHQFDLMVENGSEIFLFFWLGN